MRRFLPLLLGVSIAAFYAERASALNPVNDCSAPFSGICLAIDADPTQAGIQNTRSVSLNEDFTVDLILIGDNTFANPTALNSLLAELTFDSAILGYDSSVSQRPLAGDLSGLNSFPTITQVLSFPPNPSDPVDPGDALPFPENPSAGSTGSSGYFVTPASGFGFFDVLSSSEFTTGITAITGFNFSSQDVSGVTQIDFGPLTSLSDDPTFEFFHAPAEIVVAQEIPESSNWIAMGILLGMGLFFSKKRS